MCSWPKNSIQWVYTKDLHCRKPRCTSLITANPTLPKGTIPDCMFFHCYEALPRIQSTYSAQTQSAVRTIYLNTYMVYILHVFRNLHHICKHVSYVSYMQCGQFLILKYMWNILQTYTSNIWFNIYFFRIGCAGFFIVSQHRSTLMSKFSPATE